MVLSLYKNTPRGQHQNGKLRKTGGDKSHSSSSVYSCSCKSFVFHRNGTASGFIKIYELNYHWKYKTLVGAQGRHRRGGGWGADGERKERCWLETTRVKRRTTDEKEQIGRLDSNIFAAIFYAPAGNPFEKCYQVKHF